MKTFLLATGEQSPLSQMDNQMPSPMVPLLNRPLMHYMVELLHYYGVRDIHVSLYHLGDKIEEYFAHGQQWSVDFTYLLQHEPLGTAGAIRRAKYHIDGTFVVLPADRYIDFDLQTALNFHRAHGGVATVVLQDEPDFPLEKREVVWCNEGGLIAGMGSEGSNSDKRYLNSGVYLFEPEILAYIPKDTRYSCFEDLLPTLLQSGETVAGYVNDMYWNPCDSFAAYQHAQQTLLARLLLADDQPSTNLTLRSVHGMQESAGVWRGRNITVHPDTKIHPPVYIGSGSQLLPGAEIGPNVVLGSGVVVGRGTSIQESTVLAHTFIGESLDVADKVVNHSAFIDTTKDEVVHVDDSRLLADVSPTYYSMSIRGLIEQIICAMIFFVASPVMLAIMLLAWRTSNQSVFCLVERIISNPQGLSDPLQRGPHTIFVTHFRTRDGSNQHTKMGAWLERWDLHRLPELWNVLKGEMSLVGVQPLCPDEASLVQEEWQAVRYSCKTGFTGFWYTQTAKEADFLERCSVDAYYAATHSLTGDLWQVVLTPISWLRRRMVQTPFIPSCVTK